MQSNNRSNANGMSSRMRGALSSAMSQPRRQPTSAAQAQLDPNWQRKMNGGTSRYQASNTFLPRQGAQPNQNAGKSNSRMGTTSRQPANAFDAKAFLRQQRPGEFLRPNANQNAQPQPQPTQQQRFQQQQRAKVGTNDANFDINAFKRAAPRMQSSNQQQQQQPVQMQQSAQQQQQMRQPMQQNVQQQPVQHAVQQQAVQRQNLSQSAMQQPTQQQTTARQIQRVQPQQHPLQVQQQRVLQPQVQQGQRTLMPQQQQQVQQQRTQVQQQQRVHVQQQQVQQHVQQQQQHVVQQTPVDEDDDVDDKLPWQSASQNVASRIQKGASSKDVLQKIAALRQAAPEPAAAPAVVETNVSQNEEIDGQAPEENQTTDAEEPPRIY